MDTNVDRAFTAFRERGADEDLVALLDACRSPAVGICYQVLGNLEDAEDAAQQVLLEIAGHASELVSAPCFRTWLFRVCRARSMDCRRSRVRRESHEARAARPGISNGNGHGDAIDDVRRILFASLAELPESERTLIAEHYFERRTLRTLAERRGCSKVAVWKQLERIRTKLLRRLGSTGLAAILPMWESAPPRMIPGAPAIRATARPTSVWSAGRPAPWIVASVAGVLLLTIGMTAGAGLNRTRVPAARPVRAVASAIPLPVREIPFAPQASFVEPAPVPSRAPASVAVKMETKPEFKEMVRRLFRQIQTQRRTGQPMSPEFTTEITPIMELARVAHRDPAREPERFAEYTALLYEVGGEESGVVYTAESRTRMARLQKELGEALSRVPSAPGPGRLLAALEADLAFARGMAELIPADESARLMACDIDWILKRGKRKCMPADRLKREIAGDWVSALQIETGMPCYLEAAAGRLAASLRNLSDRANPTNDENEYSKSMVERRTVVPYDPVRRLEFQVEALKAQIEVLDSLRPGLDPAQYARLIESNPWNYAINAKGMFIEMRE